MGGGLKFILALVLRILLRLHLKWRCNKILNGNGSMKLRELRKQREARHQKQIEKRRNANRRSKKSNSLYISNPFVFDPKVVLIQPHTWLLYRFFEKPLRVRLNELALYEMTKSVFPALTEAIQREYLIEARLRWQFKRLLNAWLRHRMEKKSSDFIDPITMNPILHPIRVYDVSKRRSYVFEADSLNKAIKKNLYAHQYTIPVPKKPVNIITNKPFTYVQLVSIHDQLLSTRSRIEDFALFRTWQFQLDTWKHYMYNHIYLAGIKDELYNFQSMEGRDMLEDFIKDMIIVVKLPSTELFELVITNAIHWYPEHTLLQQLRNLCLKSYESNIFELNIGVLIATRFTGLFRLQCPLWDQVLDRMKADSDAERQMEDADVIMT